MLVPADGTVGHHDRQLHHEAGAHQRHGHLLLAPAAGHPNVAAVWAEYDADDPDRSVAQHRHYHCGSQSDNACSTHSAAGTAVTCDPPHHIASTSRLAANQAHLDHPLSHTALHDDPPTHSCGTDLGIARQPERRIPPPPHTPTERWRHSVAELHAAAVALAPHTPHTRHGHPGGPWHAPAERVADSAAEAAAAGTAVAEAAAAAAVGVVQPCQAASPLHPHWQIHPLQLLHQHPLLRPAAQPLLAKMRLLLLLLLLPPSSAYEVERLHSHPNQSAQHSSHYPGGPLADAHNPPQPAESGGRAWTGSGRLTGAHSADHA